MSSERKRGGLRRLLRLPLFAKILVANSIIVGIGAFIGTGLTQRLAVGDAVRFDVPLALTFTVAGVLLSGIVNYGVLRVALRPLVELEQTADAVRAGDVAARAQPSAFGDAQMDGLAHTINTMLDTLGERSRQLQQVAGQVIGAQEEERKRIARELHDETAQSLTSLLIRLKLLEKAESIDAMRAGLGAVRDLVAQTMEEVREMSRSLRPSLLDDYGLVAALDAYIAGVRRTLPDVELTLQTAGFAAGERLAPLVELVCYRVVQEALTNALKHARARHIAVTLRRTAGTLEAEVRDDGQGFDLHGREVQTGGRGLGLIGMRERVQLVGGTVALASRRGAGTTVRAVLPLVQAAVAREEVTV